MTERDQDLIEVVIACTNGQIGIGAAREIVADLDAAGFEIIRKRADGDPVNLPFEHVPHCACDDGSGPQWGQPEYRAKTAACKLRGGPCRDDGEQPPTARIEKEG